MLTTVINAAFQAYICQCWGRAGDRLHVGGGEEVLPLSWEGINFTLPQPGMVIPGLAPRLLCLCGGLACCAKALNVGSGWVVGGSWGGSSAGAGVMLQHVNSHFMPLLGRCLITLTENETSFLLEILSRKAEELAT